MMMFIDFNSWRTALLIIDTLSEAFATRNKVLFGVGLSLFGISLLSKIFLPSKIQSNNVIKRGINIALILSVILLFLSLSVGQGKGIGIGDGDGVGIGDGAGVIIGDNVGAGSNGNDSAIAPREVFDNTIIIRIHNTEVFIGDIACENIERFEEDIKGIYQDGMQVVMLDDYAENITYVDVESVLRSLALKYRKEMNE